MYKYIIYIIDYIQYHIVKYIHFKYNEASDKFNIHQQKI
jgi:hypothetical protein